MEEVKDIVKYLDSHRDFVLGVFSGVIMIIMLFFAIYSSKNEDKNN